MTTIYDLTVQELPYFSKLSDSLTGDFVGTPTRLTIDSGTVGRVRDELLIISGVPDIAFCEADATADNKYWDIAIEGEQFFMRAVADDNLTANPWIIIDRTGITIDTVTFPYGNVSITNNVSIGGTFQVTGRLGSTWTGGTFGTNWANLGGSYAVVTFKNVGNKIELRGVAISSSASPGANIITLPSGSRPPASEIYSCMTSSGAQRIEVGAGGGVGPAGWSPGNGTWISLSGISFYTT